MFYSLEQTSLNRDPNQGLGTLTSVSASALFIAMLETTQSISWMQCLTMYQDKILSDV